MCCKLWGYCSRVILPLMRLAKLVYCIEYGDDKYFIWKVPSYFYFCVSTSFPSFQFSSLGGLSTVFRGVFAPRASLFLGFNIWVIIIVLGWSWWEVRTTFSLGRIYLVIFLLQASPSYNIDNKIKI